MEDKVPVEKSASDEDILKLCLERYKKDCKEVQWRYFKEETLSPDNTIQAIVVDLGPTGSLRVYSENGKGFVTSVGRDDFFFLIEFKENYIFHAWSGPHRVGIIR